jgi:hypothetical protein
MGDPVLADGILLDWLELGLAYLLNLSSCFVASAEARFGVDATVAPLRMMRDVANNVESLHTMMELLAKSLTQLTGIALETKQVASMKKRSTKWKPTDCPSSILWPHAN